MSTLSKFYQVTNFILLEYKTDQYAAINEQSTPESERVPVYMIKTNTGKTQCVDMANYTYTSYPEDNGGDYYFPGYPLSTKPLISDNILLFKQIHYDNNIASLVNVKVGEIMPDSEGNIIRETSCLRDTVRLYFTTGYFMNALQAISLKIDAPVRQAKLLTDIPNKDDLYGAALPLNYLRIKDNITLLQYYLPKSKLFSLCKRLPSPLYFNSKFYDRYVEITLPSGYDLAVNAGLRNIDYVKTLNWTHPLTKENIELLYRGFVDKNSPGMITFSTVSDDFVTYYNESKNEISFTPDAPTKTPITYDSNSKYFNVELFEDEETGTIVYLPVYGEPALALKMRPFDITMMNKIETGIIHMYDTADADYLNDGIEDFIEVYGEDAYKWCLINELSVSYYYDYITESDLRDAPKIEPYTEYYTNTIDYTGKTSAHGEFWKSKFLPYIQDRPMMTCTKIGVIYTAHLYNRMNNKEITRTASMIIKNPMKYNRTIINPGSINTYKVVNKIVLNIVKPNIANSNNLGNIEKLTRNNYVYINEFKVKVGNDNILYAEGNAILKLTKGPLQYMILFFTSDSNNPGINVPLKLNETNARYKITFPLANKGEKLEYDAINTSDSVYDAVDGKLLFFISGDDAERILGFTGDHIFRVTRITKDAAVQEVTLYTGQVKWNYT